MTKYYGHGKPSIERYNEKRQTHVEVASMEHLPLMENRLITTKPWEKLPVIMTASKVLETNLNHSSHAFTGFVNNVPFCMFGVCPVDGDKGEVWLLVTEDVHKVDLMFLKGSLYFLDFFKLMYAKLEAIVDAEYEAAIKWLKWLGFKLISKETMLETAVFRFGLEV